MNRAKKLINYLESVSRYCFIYKANNGTWYMELASEEYAGREDATTYGPFSSEKEAYDYLENFSNPGSFHLDKDGKRPVPDKSPNGMSVETPKGHSDFYWR